MLLEDMYIKMKYDFAQMKEINEGLCAGIDVEAYAKPELTAEDMREIKIKLLKDKFLQLEDIQGDFSIEQKMLILFRYTIGLDYTILAKPETTIDTMRKTLVELEINSGMF